MKAPSPPDLTAIAEHLAGAGRELLLAAHGGLHACATAMGREPLQKRTPELGAFLRRADRKAASLQRSMRRLATATADTLACGLRSDNPCISWASAFGLCELGRAAVPTLLKAAHAHSTQVRHEAILALGWIGPAARGAVDELTQALRDSAPRVRQAAAWALADIGPAAKKSIPALIAVLRTKDREMRDAAAEAISRITKSIAATPPPRRRASHAASPRR